MRMINEWMGRLSSAILILMIGIIFYETLARYFFKLPTVWELEVAIYLMIFITFMGAGWGLKNGVHVSVEVIIQRLSTKNRRILRTILYLIALLTFLVFFQQCLSTTMTAYFEWWTSWSALEFPLFLVYMFISIGLLLLSLQLCVEIYEQIAKKDGG